jgi:PAS domain S-box-containing protein
MEAVNMRPTSMIESFPICGQPDFRTLFESAPGSYLALTPALIIVAVSDAYLQATMTRREEILGRHLFNVFPDNPGDATATGVSNLRASLTRVLQHRVPDAMAVQRYDIRRPDTEGGQFEKRYWSPINTPVFSPNGEIAYIIHRVEDVTERKRAEETIRQSEEHFRLLVAGVKDYAILMLDPDGHVVSWNAGAERIKGYQAGEIIGQHFSRFYSPDDIHSGKPEHELKVAATEGRCEEEGWRVRKDGTRFWANGIITAMRDETGSLRGFSKVTRDITERKRAEEEFRKSEEKYRTLFESVDEGVCTIEVLFDENEKPIDYRFLEVNPSFEKQTGIQNARGRSMREIAPLHEEHWFEMYGKIALTGESVRFENQAVQLNRWYDVYALRVGNPQQRHVAIFFKDITERKLADEAIKRFNEQLLATNKELESFSYSVSHDLRAPLRSIDGFSQALLEDCGANLDEQGRGYLQRIRANSQRMGQLIDDLLNLSRMARCDINREPVDLSALTHTIVAELHGTAPTRSVDVVIAPGLTASGDARLLRVVLENLIGNAWKFTRKRSRACIEFGTIAANGTPAYFVRDDGAGFDMAYADKLFGAFQRLHDAADFEGTGIGLATVQRVVHKHGGRVWAESEPERGATFYFTLGGRKDF